MMNRRKLLAVLAGWLTVPGLASSQSGVSSFSKDSNSFRIGVSVPAYLPEPSVSEPIIPVPKPLPRDIVPEKPSPAAEIVLPRRVDPKSMAPPAATSCDLQWMNRGCSAADGSCGRGNSLGFGLLANDPRTVAWIVPEYLIWRRSGMHVPALVTGSPLGTPAANTGVPGDPSTSVLFGNQSMLNGYRSGLRVRAGFWFDNTQTLGLDASILFLGQQNAQQTFTSSGDPGLARPFFDVLRGAPNSETIAFGNRNAAGMLNPALTGTILARATSDLWGADANLRRYLWESGNMRVDGLLGFRYQLLRDTVDTASLSTINDNTNEPINLLNGTTLRIHDAFQTTNAFYGGQVGLAGQWQRDRWALSLNAKVALGSNERDVRINGTTTIGLPVPPPFVLPGRPPITLPAPPPLALRGGLLALPSNSGRHVTNVFSVIPDIGINLGYQLTPNVRVFGGYSAMYWTHVVRAGDQIDTGLNASQATRSLPPAIPNGPTVRPGFTVKESGYWANGGNAGIEFRW